MKEPKGDDQAERNIFYILPQGVVTHMCPFLDTDSLGNFSNTSETSKNDAIKSAIIQLQRLNEELNQLITDSGITGIQKPEGPFKNPIHELRVLTAFKDALPNAIRVLKAKGITDINARDGNETTPLHWAAFNGHREIVLILRAAQHRQTSYFSACTIM